MSKKIVQLAEKFSKIIVRSQATVAPGAKKLVSPIRGKKPEAIETPLATPDGTKNVSLVNEPNVNPSKTNTPYVLVPNALQKALSELVDVLKQIWEKNPALKTQSSDGMTEINTAWTDIIDDGQEVPGGIMIPPAVEPLLEALHHTFLFLRDVAKAPANDVSKAADLYGKFSRLGTPTSAATTYVHRDLVETIQKALNNSPFNYPKPLVPDGKLGPLTRIALQWFRDNHLKGENLDDEKTMDAIIQMAPTSQPKADPNSATPTWTSPLSGGRDDSVLSEPTKASRLANQFLAKLGKL